jgi:methylenetetrahydrofolate dehydrogenase (NADP+)/methenyltetrahydrofolate cyclohydrolase
MRILNGSDLSSFIKARQQTEVRSLIQASHIKPKLAIIITIDNPVINLYVKLKQSYGKDIGIEVEIHRIKQSEANYVIEQLNNDESIHGIILQLPIEDPSQTDELVNLVSKDKDVDALGLNANFDPATPTAILWLLAGYNIDFSGKKVLLIGEGKLVGKPLFRMLQNSNVDVSIANDKTKDIINLALSSDIIVTATGSPAVLNSSMVKEKAVVVDAGVASEGGKTVGDVDDDLYERDDITITPKKGGVGPLTVCALFQNVLISARRKIKTD